MSKETRENLTTVQETGVTLGCGVTAGVAAAVLSQPADTLLSKVSSVVKTTSCSETHEHSPEIGRAHV